jgi:heme-degrading monooxygenase HmoA
MSPGTYVVVFVSRRSGADAEGYAAMAERMEQLAHAQPGFMGMQSVRGDDGVGITVCYWQTAEAISAWKRDVDHAAAQQRGRERWYESYEVTVARVERHYGA